MTALLAAIALAVGGGAVPVQHHTLVTLGYSSEGRPITATMTPARQAPRILVFGCIHGDECAGTRVVRRLWGERSRRVTGLITVKNLNPDGLALGSRLNGDGVDLNRNFGYDWRPIGVPGDPEHSGPAPFSEPERRIARRVIRALHPDVTIWFHQQSGPLVRAWGPSIPAARTYARLAGDHFVPMPWMDGTAPNWQNHAFPGTSSFVVELPANGPVHAARHSQAVLELAEKLR